MEIAYYFDTSALLAMLFSQPTADRALAAWEEAPQRLGSVLAHFECLNVNHRYSERLPEKARKVWQVESEAWIDRTMSSISLHEINTSVLLQLKREPRLGEARTLDAIHLATALLFRSAGIEVRVVSFDERMLRSATALGFVSA